MDETKWMCVWGWCILELLSNMPNCLLFCIFFLLSFLSFSPYCPPPFFLSDSCSVLHHQHLINPKNGKAAPVHLKLHGLGIFCSADCLNRHFRSSCMNSPEEQTAFISSYFKLASNTDIKIVFTDCSEQKNKKDFPSKGFLE